MNSSREEHCETSRSLVSFIRRLFVSFVYLVRSTRSSRLFVVRSPRSFASFVRSPRSYVRLVRLVRISTVCNQQPACILHSFVCLARSLCIYSCNARLSRRYSTGQVSFFHSVLLNRTEYQLLYLVKGVRGNVTRDYYC